MRPGRRGRLDAAGVGSVVAMALAYLSPALKDGWYFGSYDAAANGTIGHPGNPVNRPVYNRLSGDLVNQGIPWNTLDWRLVHAGHLPLWNSYNVLGLPQLFNFESAGLSFPDLVSYAVPLRYAWLVIALVKLLVAGTGAYVLVRQLGVGPLGASFAGISFMLSGGYANWLGWPLSGVVAFAPWILAFMLLSYRDRRHRWSVLLAVSVMFAFFGGFPEMYALLAGALAVFATAAGVTLLIVRRQLPSARGLLRVLFGLAGGAALACPLLLPGAQLIGGSTYKAAKAMPTGTPLNRIVSFLSAGYYGLPIRGSVTFRGINFYETTSYISILALALALVGAGVARRQAAAVGMVLLTLACLLMTYRLGPLNLGGKVLVAFGLESVHANRIRLLADLGVAVLGGVGLDRIVTDRGRSARTAWLVAAAAGAGVVVAVAVASAVEHLRGALGAERFDALLWPCGLAVAGLLSAVLLVVFHRRGVIRAAVGTGLVALQAAALLFAAVGLNTWTSVGYRHYSATTELSRIVGRSLVGLDGTYPGSPKTWPRLGYYPNINVVYRLAEFAAHDPLLPVGYARTFPAPPRQGRGPDTLSPLDIPRISSATLARQLGIGYLLVQPRFPVPSGTRLVTTISGERLVVVEGAERFSLAGASAGRVTSWEQPADNRWVLHVDAPSGPASSRLLVLRLTRVPGFTATAGGRALLIQPYGAFEMAVTVPRGVSTVTITYWPGRFTDGLVIAAIAMVVLALWCAFPLVRRPHA